MLTKAYKGFEGFSLGLKLQGLRVLELWRLYGDCVVRSYMIKGNLMGTPSRGTPSISEEYNRNIPTRVLTFRFIFLL